MSQDRRNVLDVLRYELNFLEQGGYRPAGTAQPASPFQDSLSCLNFGEPLRPHACHECALYDFVPVTARTEDVPCHHIPIDPAGHTVAAFLTTKDFPDLERALKIWLRRTIASIEEQQGANKRSA